MVQENLLSTTLNSEAFRYDSLSYNYAHVKNINAHTIAATMRIRPTIDDLLKILSLSLINYSAPFILFLYN